MPLAGRTVLLPPIWNQSKLSPSLNSAVGVPQSKIELTPASGPRRMRAFLSQPPRHDSARSPQSTLTEGLYLALDLELLNPTLETTAHRLTTRNTTLHNPQHHAIQRAAYPHPQYR